MTEVLHSPSHFPSSLPSNATEDQEDEERHELSLLTLLVAALRRSLVGCSIGIAGSEDLCSMEIGMPTNVRHVAHVTFDRFHGFLGLPDELEPEVSPRAPSASANVFGVSTESMQLSFDARGNSVPTILLMMQRRLYAHGGLQFPLLIILTRVLYGTTTIRTLNFNMQAEGIFRINAENAQEEYVRDQLNMGVVPDDVDVHCLAGLIKAWFRELPTGILDSLSPELVMQSQSEEQCVQLVRHLPPTEAALLDWAVNLMADVAQLEHANKMNARNVAMVFAPNMTQMVDPLTALMYAVQVMNFLKSLIIRTLREREDSVIEPSHVSHVEPSDENGRHSPSQPIVEEVKEGNEEERIFVGGEPVLESPPHPTRKDSTIESGYSNFPTPVENIILRGSWKFISQVNSSPNSLQEGDFKGPSGWMRKSIIKNRSGQSSNLNLELKKVYEQPMVQATGAQEMSKVTSIISRMNSRTELVEVWR